MSIYKEAVILSKDIKPPDLHLNRLLLRGKGSDVFPFVVWLIKQVGGVKGFASDTGLTDKSADELQAEWKSRWESDIKCTVRLNDRNHKQLNIISRPTKWKTGNLRSEFYVIQKNTFGNDETLLDRMVSVLYLR